MLETSARSGTVLETPARGGTLLETSARGGTGVAVARQELRLQPDPARVVALPLQFAPAVLAERVERVLRRTDAQAAEALRDMTGRFGWRHRDLTAQLRRRWAELVDLLHLDPSGIGEDRRLLAAAYTTMEYAVEAAALCNPSIVPAPDQRGAGPGELRVVVSLRAIGEGHRSTVEFRTGTVDAAGRLRLDPAGRWATPGHVTPGPDGYTVRFDPATPLDERVLYAAAPDETLGLEDARFVPLRLPDGSTSWAATYTAYNGRDITIKLIRTDDFTTFTVRPMTGPGVSDKGIALFPRQVGGRWWALGRQDGQRLFVMTSPDLVHWDDPRPLADPVHDWELVQMGNCGSPVETPAGWLVVTHGVGMLRRYVMSAMLLDRDDPGVVLGRLERPLLEPDEDEREGYVPNVLYSCGGLVHGGRLVLPYAYSDRACSVASVDVEELIAAMR
ncbi:glycoside hydrolase family 130 protein [Dactylosporangium aurantiacum]|nr:glycoside hydrolase family 130 protein [Dactylosporangium aurantiacum]MDG6105901.1 glycoside hydrolase family 130 protein [Dactylosporangium aurantiacum]